MDQQTLEYYDLSAAELAAKYRAIDQNACREQFQEMFPAGARVLDVGAEVGSDCLLLGKRATAVRATV